MTNNVEEAEIVGDRIVIINEAEIEIKGTLKHIRGQFRKSPESFQPSFLSRNFPSPSF